MLHSVTTIGEDFVIFLPSTVIAEQQKDAQNSIRSPLFSDRLASSDRSPLQSRQTAPPSAKTMPQTRRGVSLSPRKTAARMVVISGDVAKMMAIFVNDVNLIA